MIRYAISDPSTLRFDRLREDLERFLQKGATMLLYRDKSNPHYADDAHSLIGELRKFSSLPIFLHNDPWLAQELQADGVHLSADRIAFVQEATRANLRCIVSTHSLHEAQAAQEAGAGMITLSPLFPSPGKGKPLGMEEFSRILALIEIPVIALGGVLGEDQIEQIRATKAAGFASIRYFGV